MLADRDRWQRTRKHGDLLGDLFRNPRQQGFDLGGHVLAREQITELGEGAIAIQVHDLGALDRQPRAPQHVDLNGGVWNVLFLDAGRGLDLDQGEAVAGPLEDVDGRIRAVGQERGLVEDTRATIFVNASQVVTCVGPARARAWISRGIRPPAT